MSIVSVQPKSFILALFIRDDNERFLLGDNGYDFKDSQLHFAANTIENDEVQKQGADGVMIAGQVRRASVQSFDGFVGDATMAKETIEQMRRDFIAFFLKGHHYRVIYVDCNRNAWQRKGGYLVDAPEVKELWQIHPEYHVGLNFEDVNYYSYDEDADGNEILANLVNVPVSTEIEGGLVWDEDGAVSEEAGDISYDEETADATPAKNVYITDATEAPLASFQLDGETSQSGTPTPDAPVAVNTTTGENVVNINGKNLIDVVQRTFDANGVTVTVGEDNTITLDGTPSANYNKSDQITISNTPFLPVGSTYTYSLKYVSGSANGGTINLRLGATTTAHNIQFSQNMTMGNADAARTVTMAGSGSVGVSGYVTKIQLIFGTNNTFSNYKIQLQLEAGSSASSFEPYQGQSYEVNLGKNLINFDSFQQSWDGASVEGEGTTITMSPNTSGSMGLLYDSTTYSVSIPAGRTITWSRTWAGGGTWERGAIAFPLKLTYSDGTTETLSFGDTTERNYNQVISATKVLTKSVVSVKIERGGCFGITNLSAPTSFNLQLELGSQATSYAPYFEPIELCKIGTYQDYIYKSDGKWYVRKSIQKFVFNGLETWNSWYVVGDCIGFYHDAPSLARIGNEGAINGALFCDKLSEVALRTDIRDGLAMGMKQCGGAGFQYIAIGIAKSELSDYSTKKNAIASFKTWLANNNLTFYGTLATPTDTEITNQALIAQLDNVASAPLYTGVNNITTITPNEQGTLEISYYTKYQPMIGSGGYVWEAGGAGGPTVIINNSIDNVSPVWTIYGPTTNPQLENATTGETIEYVGTIAQGQTLTIDMGEQTASLDGLNVISNLVGDFIQLAPGRNNMIYSVSGEAGASELGWSEIVG